MTDEQAKEIGRQIAEGFTSGRLDEEQGDTDTFCYVAWKLKIEEWCDD